MLRIIRVRLPTEWACHWRKLYFYLLCRVSLGLPLALSLPLSICTAAELGIQDAGCFSKCLKGAVNAAVMHLSDLYLCAFFPRVGAHHLYSCARHGHLYSGVDPSSVGVNIHICESELTQLCMEICRISICLNFFFKCKCVCACVYV